MRLMRIIVSLIYMADTKKHIRTQMSSYIYPHLRQESQTEIDFGRKLNLPVILRAFNKFWSLLPSLFKQVDIQVINVLIFRNTPHYA